MIRNELEGDVNNEFVTLVTVNVKLVDGLIVWDSVNFINVDDMTVHDDDIALFNVHVDVDEFSWVYDGNVMLI